MHDALTRGSALVVALWCMGAMAEQPETSCQPLSQRNRCENGGTYLSSASTRSDCRKACKAQGTMGCCMFEKGWKCTFNAGTSMVAAPALYRSYASECTDVSEDATDCGYSYSYSYGPGPCGPDIKEGPCNKLTAQRKCQVQATSRDETDVQTAQECVEACQQRGSGGCCMYFDDTKVCSFEASTALEIVDSPTTYATLCVGDLENPTATAATTAAAAAVSPAASSVKKASSPLTSPPRPPPPPPPKPPPPPAPPPPKAHGKGAVAVVGTIVGIVVVVTMGAGLARLRHDSTVSAMIAGGGGLQDLGLIKQVAEGRSDDARHQDAPERGIMLTDIPTSEQLVSSVAKIV